MGSEEAARSRRVAVDIGGGVRGQFVVGDHNVTVTGTHSTVTVVRPGERPQPVRREHIELLPRQAGQLIGRQSELNLLVRAVATGEPVQVYGPSGIGKSTLVRHAAHELAGFGAGVVFLDAAGRDEDDLVQDIFESCYDTAGYRPGVIALRRFMAGLRVCLVIDDLTCPVERLTPLLDAVPAGAVLFTSTERLLWGQGQAVALDGLTEDDGRALLARQLGRPLRPDDSSAASALWKAAGGHPVDLIRAAAVARPGPDGLPVLPRPAEVAGLVARVLDQLEEPARDVVGILATAGSAPVSADLLHRLVTGFETPAAVRAAADSLAALGVVVVSERGYRLAPGLPGGLGLGSERLDRLVQRLTGQALSPQLVADNGAFIATLIEAANQAGRPALGAQLARAAAPAAACSLRWGVWRRILHRGLDAAKRAGDKRTQAYLTHEEGVRSLLTGKRVAASAAFAAALAIWHHLGDAGNAAAQHAGTQADVIGNGNLPSDLPPTDLGDQVGNSFTPDPGTPAPEPPQAPQYDTPPPDSGPDPGGPGAGGDSSAPPPVDHPTIPPTGGVGNIRKIIYATLSAGAVGAVFWGTQGLGSSGDAPVPVTLKVSTGEMQVAMPPGDRSGPCQSNANGTNCTVIVQRPSQETLPIEIHPETPLRQGINVLYYGCTNMPSPTTEECSVETDRPRYVCITTTADSTAVQDACRNFILSNSNRSQDTDRSDNPLDQDSRSNQPELEPVPLTLDVTAPSQFAVTVTARTTESNRSLGSKECGRIDFGSNRCVFTNAPANTEIELTAVFRDGPAPPQGAEWYGCEQPARSSTCTVRMPSSSEKKVCLVERSINDEGGRRRCNEEFPG